MGKFSKYELFANLGFDRDPFKAIKHETADSIRLRRILKMAIKDHAMISIVGERGIGKTSAIEDALAELKLKPIMVNPAGKERILVDDIEQEMIYGISDEKPKRGKVVRSKQLRRLVGEAATKVEVVLVIEEAHRIHGQTLRSLKTLREMKWMGEKDLFTIIFVGQSDPMNKAGVAEVRLRSDSVQMQGLTSKEIEVYVNDTIGSMFSEEVVSDVALMPDARNFLNLQAILLKLISNGVSNGRDTVTREDFIEVFGKGVSKPVKRSKTGNAAKKGNDTLRGVMDRHKGGKKGLSAIG
jgi:type II secretory pathway predicted ATPase ExeA